jgi:hypothetical protein
MKRSNAKHPLPTDDLVVVLFLAILTNQDKLDGQTPPQGYGHAKNKICQMYKLYL